MVRSCNALTMSFWNTTLFSKRYVYRFFIIKTLQINTCIIYLFRSFFSFFFIQAGEFFHTAQRSAVVQHRETEGQQSAEASLESPLLHEQVLGIFISMYTTHTCTIKT